MLKTDNHINSLGNDKFTTHLDGIIDGIIFGWFNYPIKTKTPEIRILINGTEVDKFIDFLPAQEIHPNAHRFFIDLKKYNIKEKDEVCLLLEDQSIDKTPLILERNRYFALIDGFSANECTGWAGSIFGEFPKLQVVIDENFSQAEIEWYIREDFRKRGFTFPTGLKFKIPEKYCDSKKHKICLANALTNQKICEEREFSFFIKNFIVDIADNERIEGWIQVGEYPGPVELDIYIEGKKSGSCKADFIREDAEKLHGRGCYGFYYPLPEEDRLKITKEVVYNFSFCLRDTNIKIGDSYYSIPVVEVIEGLEKIGQYLREKNGKNFSFALKNAIETLKIGATRDRRVIIKKVDTSDIVETVDIVDIIIPVYKGKKETIECIESVLNAKTNVKYELIIINDFCPDDELKEELLKFAGRDGIILLENKENLGFVKTVNIGMKLHPNRDVVLLNSDTLVPDYWLDRLKKAAYLSKNVGTVTPLSNKATILSIPKSNNDNDLPEDFDHKKMDDLCRLLNRDRVVDIPTAIGFCMYIKRECLNEVGFFDEEKFDKGYGEENDFCLKASSFGWRHLACLDLFVQHHGNLSFGEEKSQRVKRALQILNQLHPDYNLRIQKFIENDPIAPYRNRIVKEIIKQKHKRLALFVSHSFGGGVEKYCKDISKELLKENIVTLLLSCNNSGTSAIVSQEETNTKRDLEFWWAQGESLKNIFEFLKDLNIEFIHYNHTLGFRELEIWELPEFLRVPYYVTLHDYFYLCPRINLVDLAQNFCGLPDVNFCEICLMNGKLQREVKYLFEEKFNSSIVKWREFYKEILGRAKKVIAPSQIVREIYERIFKIDKIVVKPHLDKILAEIKKPEKVERLRIAIIGAIGDHKGYSQLLHLVDYTEKEALPFDFYIIGYTKNDKDFEKYKNVTITGKYKEKELSTLIRVYHPHIALFLSMWPETYNYTLSEALNNKLYPIAYDIGAIAERMKELKIGTLIPFPSATKKIAEILLELHLKGWQRKELIFNNDYKSIMRDYYEAN
ncbi:MAG: glycosyltransferase [Thermodesulfovibrionales bacterium]|nr:glycosyltransferase [Thermodesulfovibrionales bacterium]